MTDEALKPWTQRGEKLMTENERLRTENAALLDQIHSVVGIHDEVDRLRAENQRLVEAATAYIMAIASGDGYDIALKYAALLAAIEGK